MWVVHWPGKAIIMCDRHKLKAKALADALGFEVSCTSVDDDETFICTNCENEAKK